MLWPKLRRNSMSISLLDETNASFVGKEGKISVNAKCGKKLFEANKYSSLYFINPQCPDLKMLNYVMGKM